jgi:hypothetical protein
MPTPQRPHSGLLDVYPHLTLRDRQLLALLDDHQVLTTDQVHRLLFQARRTCQLRLAELRQLGLVQRFRYARPHGGTYPWHWTLGIVGARFQAAVYQQNPPTDRAHRQLVERLSANPHLNHLIATNELFVRLAAHARSHPDTRLRRWWSEQRCTQLFQTVAPDGHGLWSVGAATVGFFVECDRRTESHRRVLGKLDGYQRLATNDGPRYPVLFWLSSPEREAALQAALRQRRSAVPVATTTHTSDPAGRVWLTPDRTQRVGLHELASFHGRDTAANPNFRDGELVLDEHGFLQPATG